MNYYYKYKFKSEILEKNTDKIVDPASISKLYIAIYCLKKFSYQELSSNFLSLEAMIYKRNSYGTVRLQEEDVDREFSMKTLLEYMIADSCNIATGVLVKSISPGKINQFIKDELHLYDSTILDRNNPSQNITSINDLSSAIEKAILKEDYLEEKNREYLIKTLGLKRRRSELCEKLSSLYPKYKYYYKCGLTLTGLRRELVIFGDERKIDGYFILFQEIQKRDLVPEENNQKIVRNKFYDILCKDYIHTSKIKRFLCKKYTEIDFKRNTDKLLKELNGKIS